MELNNRSIRGMEKKLITCLIVGVDSSVLVNYGALRGNDCQADWVHKPFIHELVFTMEGLTKECGKVSAAESVNRYATALGFGYDEMTALRKICDWSEQCISRLSTIFKMYQNLQTLDAKDLAARQSRKIMSGRIIAVPNTLFKKLSKMDVENFMANANLVIDKKFSLKKMVNEYQQFTKRIQVSSCVQEIFEMDSFEKVQELYPTRFDDSILDKFEGACVGHCKNEIGKALEEYCNKVKSNEMEESRVKLYECKDISMLDLTKFDSYDLLVLNFGSLSTEEIDDLLEKVLSDCSLSLLILFEQNKNGLEVISDIMAVYSELDAKLLVFKQENTVTVNKFRENISLGTVIVNDWLKTSSIESYCESVDSVVSRILPSGGKIAFISDMTIFQI